VQHVRAGCARLWTCRHNDALCQARAGTNKCKNTTITCTYIKSILCNVVRYACFLMRALKRVRLHDSFIAGRSLNVAKTIFKMMHCYSKQKFLGNFCKCLRTNELHGTGSQLGIVGQGQHMKFGYSEDNCNRGHRQTRTLLTISNISKSYIQHNYLIHLIQGQALTGRADSA
jgi:hypothetical protein